MHATVLLPFFLIGNEVIDFAQTLIVRHFVRLNCRVNFRELHSCTVVARTVQGSKCQYYLNVENTGIQSMSNTRYACRVQYKYTILSLSLNNYTKLECS